MTNTLYKFDHVGNSISPALLANRTAKCACGKTEPSERALLGELAFFEFYGDGSNHSRRRCAHCTFYDVAHQNARAILKIDHEFEAHGAFEFDKYYCGCGGWD